MNKTMRWALLILIVAVSLGLIGMGIYLKFYSNPGHEIAGILTVSQSQRITVYGAGYTYYQFNPPTSDYYEIAASDTNSSVDGRTVSAVLLDEDWHEVERDSGTYIDITCFLRSGKTYYLGVRVNGLTNDEFYIMDISVAN